MRTVHLPCGCRFAADCEARRYVSDRCEKHRKIKNGVGEPLSHSLYRVVEFFGDEEEFLELYGEEVDQETLKIIEGFQA